MWAVDNGDKMTDVDATSTTWNTGSSRRTVFWFCRYCLRHDVWEVYWYIEIHNNFSFISTPEQSLQKRALYAIAVAVLLLSLAT